MTSVHEIHEIIEYVVKQLVDQPDQVVISLLNEEGKRVVNIRVAEKDIGKVIGKEGQTIKALRSLAYLATNKDGNPVVLDVIS